MAIISDAGNTKNGVFPPRFYRLFVLSPLAAEESNDHHEPEKSTDEYQC
jgi:hypothetical protein